MKLCTGRILCSFVLLCYSVAVGADNGKTWRPEIPKVWDDAALADWITPVAGLNLRPAHVSAKEYYGMPEYNLRSYPVYLPGREPKGYWEMLQRVGPQPLFEPEKLKTEADWIAAGERIFEEASTPQLTTFDPQLITQLRDREFLERHDAKALPDGTILLLRWVPTSEGMGLTSGGVCGGCHTLRGLDGTRLPGVSRLANVSRERSFNLGGVNAGLVEAANSALRGSPPFVIPDGPLGARLYQAYGVPWLKNDPNQRLQNITPSEYSALVAAERSGGVITRWNGSPLFPAKIPDLIGVKDRRYFDHTATHLHRGIGDLMRYAAQVTFAEVADFGPYHVLSPGAKRIRGRLPDAALYALALYVYSLKPPPNPNLFDAGAEAGQQIFVREGCPTCHTPPLYTNNRLTLAKGFSPPKDMPGSLDVLPVTVGTDPGLALETRKGTGYYKVPSLKGVWYRGHYLHDGSVASLEEMFDPDRLKETHIPGGYSPPGVSTRAVPGHEFGLKLEPREREQLIAFLRTL
jgi:mono/diheme cytochrome c family protein